MMNREEYEKQKPDFLYMRESVKNDPNRLHFHLMPPTGWMNDPNGLCQFRGIYHIYFQYTPFLAGWGTKLWGHYTTEDWLHFEECEPFLFPDCAWDRDGVYSGSAFVQDGQIHYFYTGNVKLTDQPYDYIMEGREQNTIHFVSADGMQAGEKHLVMTNGDYSSGMSKHVRDPKIYCEKGRYYMIQGARDASSRGCALLFVSEDLKSWSYLDRIQTQEPFGYMWECPDLFELDGHKLLMVCPQGLSQDGHKYQNVYQCGYFPAELDFEKREYRLGAFCELDKGFDIYAAQTFQDERGRRILIGWMGIPDADYDNDATVAYDWIHALTMPRVLTFREGRLIQQPMEEMKRLRQEKRMTGIQSFDSWNTSDCCFEMSVQREDVEASMILQLREDVTLTYREHVLALELGKSGHGRKRRTVWLQSLRSFTVFSDTSSIEIFINDGEEVMTTRVYSDTLSQTVRFLQSGTDGAVCVYRLGSFSYRGTLPTA
ncbi:MAG: glycoside hydrolase family 32 protein [Lachnospiraceae bacterium]